MLPGLNLQSLQQVAAIGKKKKIKKFLRFLLFYITFDRTNAKISSSFRIKKQTWYNSSKL